MSGGQCPPYGMSRADRIEDRFAGVAEFVAFCQAEQLVVLRQTLASGHRSNFQLTSSRRDDKVGDRRVFGLPASSGNDRPVTIIQGQLQRLQSLGQCPDLVQLNQNAVADSGVNAALQPLLIRHEEVVADQLNSVTKSLRQYLPAFPVIFVKSVFDADELATSRPMQTSSPG